MNTKDIDLGVAVHSSLRTTAASNEDAFKAILTLYARPGWTIVDPTYGHGVFWSKVDRSTYRTICTDLSTDHVDLRALPHDPSTIDMVVLDPPYRYTPSKHQPHEMGGEHGAVDAQYKLKDAQLKNTQSVLDLYTAGFAEAHRVLRQGGILVAKCQDTVQDGKNVWVHCTLMTAAESLGFACRDLCIVTPATVLATRWDIQRHLRKAHSYFLVFRKGGHFPFGIPSVQKR